MATASPGLLVALNQGKQDLFTISYPLENVPKFDTIGPVALMQFPVTSSVSIGSNATIDNDTGIVTLQAGLTYRIEARAFPVPNQKQPLFYAIGTIADGSFDTPISYSSEVGSVSISFFTPSVETEIAVAIFGESLADSNLFVKNLEYPSQVENAAISIQVIDGFTSA